VGSNVTDNYWNYDNMLTQVVSGSNTYSYTYDGLGNRVAKVENSTTTRYVVEPRSSTMLAETDASGNVTAYYVYGLGLISKITPSDEAYYYHYDGLGSIVAMTDSDANIVNKYAYDAYGKVVSQVEAVSNPFKYVGLFGVMDEGNGLLHMRARYYDTEMRRFINKDPIGFLGGDLNLYAYVVNNPVRYVDPWGLEYFDANFSAGWFGAGITFGVMIDTRTQGYYSYLGGGIMTPGFSFAITKSPQSPSRGWSIGLQGQGLVGIGAAQGGYSFGECGGFFYETGYGGPLGYSLTGFYVWGPY